MCSYFLVFVFCFFPLVRFSSLRLFCFQPFFFSLLNHFINSSSLSRVFCIQFSTKFASIIPCLWLGAFVFALPTFILYFIFIITITYCPATMMMIFSAIHYIRTTVVMVRCISSTPKLQPLPTEEPKTNRQLMIGTPNRRRTAEVIQMITHYIKL